MTGSATLGGTLTANAVGGPYTLNRIFPVISAIGPLTGTFSSLTPPTGDFGWCNEPKPCLRPARGLPRHYRHCRRFADLEIGARQQRLEHRQQLGSRHGTDPTDIAQFNTSTITTIDIQQANTQVGGLQFNAVAGAPAYTFNITGTGSGPPRWSSRATASPTFRAMLRRSW